MRYEESSFAWAAPPATAPAGEAQVSDRQTVAFSVTDGIALVLLNRPAQRNAMTSQLVADLADVLSCCDQLEEVRAVVLSGAGPAFCVRAELSGGPEVSFGDPAPDGQDITWISPYQVRKPVIAALHGHAVGAGLTLAMQCDLRIVAQDAKLAFPFVRRGVIAEWMGHWTALQLLGIGRAAELFFTGRVFLGREAAEWGLANSALPAAEVLPAAMALAAQIAEHAAPVPLAVTKRLLWESLESGREVSGRRERLLLEELLASPDAAEGVRSFLARRQPQWTGRSTADAPAWPD